MRNQSQTSTNGNTLLPENEESELQNSHQLTTLAFDYRGHFLGQAKFRNSSGAKQRQSFVQSSI